MSLSSRWARFSDRNRRALLLATVAVALAGGVGTARLYGDLRPDMTELLPASSPSAMDLREVTRRVGGFAELTVVLHGSDPGTLVLFADDLADRLATAPRDLVKWVEYRVDAAREFYRRRLLLFADEAQLRELRDTLRARVSWEKASARGRATGPAPDVEGLVERLAEAGGHELRRFPQGYFLGEVPGRRPGEKVAALAMLVRLAGSPDDYPHVEAMARLVESEVAALDPKGYSPTLEVSYAGYVASAILEHDALAEDLIWATALVLLSVAAVVAIYNRTWKAVPAVGLPLLAGALATFGIAELWVGHLNSNTAFLGSIVVGNGINVGLILFARYLEERRHGWAPLQAMETALSATWLATLTAAFAAGAAYASLVATDFRGFNQFGLIGGVGMALSWVFSYLVTPALVLAWERIAPIPRAGQRPARPIFTQAVSHAVDRAPRATALAALAITAVSLVFIHRFSRDPFEYDFKNLRNLTALEEGGPSWWDERVDALFGDHLTPTALLAHDEAEAREIARRLEEHKARTPGTAFGPVLSIASLVPERQGEKLPLVREIVALATPQNLAFLPPDRRMMVEAVLPPPHLRPFGFADLPEEVRRTLTEVDGRVGTAVLVYPSLRVDVWNGRDVLRFAEELRSIEMPRPGVPMASSLLVFADVLYAIARDGPRATLLSLAGVALIVFVAFGLGKRSVGSLADAAWVLASLLLGVIWFMGMAGALDLRLNMLNFIAFPITFGIGVDYATNVFQRRRIDHARSIADVIRTTGGAVALCSVTTIIGYSSLLVARNQALISFGLLADLGELACLAAALLALPAVLRWRELRAEARAARSLG
ncbi:MAG TPA: MMPL family transporter [Anaeromyxobacteraceae bacterium]|nr:MMPL family transporter [Anaeromyxobacteraceae bacterium]